MKKLMYKKGFTIIEVIIVLVVGAVIMLAVFVVVPQLQQSARNNQRRNDIQRVLVAARQYYTTKKFIDLSDPFNPGVGSADGVNIKNIISSTFQDPSLSATGNGIRAYEIKPRTGGRAGVVTWIEILNNRKCRANQMTTSTATDLIPSEGSIAVTLDVEPLTAALNADGNYRGKGYYCVSD